MGQIRKPADILNREHEWAELAELWNDRRAHLVFVHGRRRVGKSWLLQRFTGRVDGLYYQAKRGTRSPPSRRSSSPCGTTAGRTAASS